jgi:hypothetical protein
MPVMKQRLGTERRKWQLVYDTVGRELYVEAGGSRLEVNDALKRDDAGAPSLRLIIVDLFH